MNVKVMGIVNITPDSFSDGGKYFTPEEAIRRAKNLLSEGADIIDLGAESTRPGATALAWQEEWERLEPVLSAIKRENRLSAYVSIDTYHPETAERAVAMGADMINCVKEETTLEMFGIAKRAKRTVELVIPATYSQSIDSSIPIYFDPMIGFGTTREEDLELIRGVPELAKRGRVLVGVSRKRIVKKLTGEKVTGKNLGGNLALAMWCAMNGASCIRVHDVMDTVQAMKVLAAL